MDILTKATEELKQREAALEEERHELDVIRNRLRAKEAHVKGREERVLEREEAVTDREEAAYLREGEISASEAALEHERGLLRESVLVGASVIELNVGGTIVVTTISTLTAYPDSMLTAMFSGRHELAKDGEGRIFLDRSSSAFAYILEWLRDYPHGQVRTQGFCGNRRD